MKDKNFKEVRYIFSPKEVAVIAATLLLNATTTLFLMRKNYKDGFDDVLDMIKH